MTEYYIGIDGGGSKTAFVISDNSSSSMSHVTLGRSNPNDIGIKTTIALVIQGVTALCDQARISTSQVTALFGGLSGVTASDFIDRIKNAVSEFLPNANIEISHDGMNILYAAFPSASGVAVICGTGTSCFVKTPQAIHRIGGYGLFDLLGGGYEIGRAAIAHGLRTLDGRDREGFLSRAVKDKAGVCLIQGLGELIASGRNHIASFAPLVYDAYYKEDPYAISILQDHTAYIGELINTSSRYFEGEFEVSIAGSVGKDPLTLQLLKDYIKVPAIIKPLIEEPIIGALNYAKTLPKIENNK